MWTYYDEGDERDFEVEAGRLSVYDVYDKQRVPVRVMDVNGTYQSATYHGDRYCDLTFMYYKLFDHVFEARETLDDALILGGGGCCYAKHLIATLPEARVDSVERDPRVTSIARRYFYVDRLFEEYDLDRTGRLRLVTDDARHWLEVADKRYDAVFNDAFNGNEAAPSLAGPDAMALVHRTLKPGGLYLTNIISALEGRQAKPLRLYVAALRTAFANVWVTPCARTAPDEVDNAVVIASDADYEFSGTCDPSWLQRACEARR